MKRLKATRRGNGEGCMCQRADGRWMAQISMGFDGTGRRVRKTIYGETKGDVQDQLTDLKKSKKDGMLAAPTKIKLAGYLDRWLQDVARLKVRERTFDNYERAVNRHIVPTLGNVKLDKLTTAQIEGFYATLERQGVGCHTRRLCHAVLRQALQKAVRWNLVPRNPCLDYEAPSISSKEIQPLAAEQVAALLAEAIGNRQEALYVVAVTTGMRMGEIFGLQWGDVDLAAGSIYIRRSLQERNGKLTLAEPKTKKSKREVVLPRMAVDALHEHRKRQLAAGRLATGYVFTNTEGGPLRRSHFHRADFKPLLRLAKLPEIRFHDLRHTAATLLLVEGVNPKIVAERLGHSKVGITLDLYSHVVPSMQKDAAARLDRLFGGEKGESGSKGGSQQGLPVKAG